MNQIHAFGEAVCQQVYPFFKNGAPTTVADHCSEAADFYAIAAIGIGVLALFGVGSAIDRAFFSRTVTQIAPAPQSATPPATPRSSSASTTPPIPESPAGGAFSISPIDSFFDRSLDDVIAAGKINEQDPDTGDTFLIRAFKEIAGAPAESLNQFYSDIERLVQVADVKLANKQGDTALHIACRNLDVRVQESQEEHIKFIKLLMGKGANIKATNVVGESPWAFVLLLEDDKKIPAGTFNKICTLKPESSLPSEPEPVEKDQ